MEPPYPGGGVREYEHGVLITKVNFSHYQELFFLFSLFSSPSPGGEGAPYMWTHTRLIIIDSVWSTINRIGKYWKSLSPGFTDLLKPEMCTSSTTMSTSPELVEGTVGKASLSGAAAIDIECVNVVPDPDFEFTEPSHWTLFCIPVAFHDRNGDAVESTVLMRDGPTLRDELDLIREFVQWVRDRRPESLVTYNGGSFDLPILMHRARLCAREIPGHHSADLDLEIVFEALEHRDLFQAVKRDAGYNVPLESALSYHDIDDGGETMLNGREITGADMPDLGLRILSGKASEEEIRVVEQYAASDVAPLFELSDCLD